MNRHERRHGTAHQQKKSRWWLWTILIILVLGGMWYYNYNKGTGVDYTAYAFTDDIYARPDATHVVEEFSDFECPVCQAFAPTMLAIRNNRNDTRVEYKQFPLRTIHPQAQQASEASMCAKEQNRFWAYHDVLFDSKLLDKRSLRKHAEGLGLNMDQWQQCMDEGRTKVFIQQDVLEGTNRSVRGTPTVFLDGELFNGRTVADFNAALN